MAGSADVAVGIVAQRGNERAARLAETIGATLEADGVDVAVDAETGAAIDRSGIPVAGMGDRDLVVSIGGDGTFLFVAREVDDAPLLGVNLGEVGFLNAVAPDDAVAAVAAAVEMLRSDDDGLAGREIDRLAASGDDWTLEPALNEVAVHAPQRGHAGGVDATVAVDGDPYASGRVDGVLVATPTGSTAYNLSEGGPIVHPDVGALVVTGMAAVDPMPPLVVDADSDIAIRVTGADAAYAISDGRNERTLEPPATVAVRLADDPVTVAGPQTNFFEALEKLE